MGVMNENKWECKLFESDINLIYFSYFPRKIVHLKITIFICSSSPTIILQNPLITLISQIRKIKSSYRTFTDRYTTLLQYFPLPFQTKNNNFHPRKRYKIIIETYR